VFWIYLVYFALLLSPSFIQKRVGQNVFFWWPVVIHQRRLKKIDFLTSPLANFIRFEDTPPPVHGRSDRIAYKYKYMQSVRNTKSTNSRFCDLDVLCIGPLWFVPLGLMWPSGRIIINSYGPMDDKLAVSHNIPNCRLLLLKLIP